MQNEINKLIAQHLAGTISAEDKAQLDRLRSADAKLDKAIRHIEELDDFTRRYTEFAGVDSEAALDRFLNRRKFTFKRFNWRAIAASVAALMVLTVGSVMYLNNTDDQHVAVEQKLPQDVMTAMQQSTEKGLNQSTTVALKNIRMDEGNNNIPVNGTKEERIAALVAQLTHTPVEHIDAKMDELLATTTYYDKEFWLKLDDGTLVHINNNTRVIYPEHFGSSKREVIIDGEAYFMVAHDDSRPFIVHTPQGDVRDYGTEFNINTRIQYNATEVTLAKGSISVTPIGGKEHMVKPGQLAVISGKSKSVHIETTDITPYISWNTGEYIFDGCKLSKLLHVLSSWYNLRVEFVDYKSKDIEITGRFDRYKDARSTLNSISYVTGRKISLSDGKITVY